MAPHETEARTILHDDDDPPPAGPKAPKRGRAPHLVLGGVAVVALVGVVVGLRWYSNLRKEAIRWSQAKEIYSQSIEKEGSTWHVSIESLIDKPPYQVWEALKQPERSSEFIDAFRKSELLEESENRKVVRMQIQVLTLPALGFDAEFRFDDARLRASMKSLGTPPQEVDAGYEVVPSPEGTKTLVRYRGDVTNRVQLPLADAVQRGAIQELFVKTVRALHAGIDAAEKEVRDAAAQWAKVPEIGSESIERRGEAWHVSFESRIAAPVERVWAALENPRGWTGSSKTLESVQVEADEPAEKTLRLRLRLLSLPPQTLRAEIAYDAAARSARVHTLEARLQDLDATYRVEAAEGGTLVHYQAVATDRVAVTLPEEVQRAAIRQLYAETVRALGRLAAEERPS